jgi:hypothetical protein
MTGDPPTDGVFGRELSLSRGIAYVLVSQHIDWKMAFKRSADRSPLGLSGRGQDNIADARSRKSRRPQGDNVLC